MPMLIPIPDARRIAEYLSAIFKTKSQEKKYIYIPSFHQSPREMKLGWKTRKWNWFPFEPSS